MRWWVLAAVIAAGLGIGLVLAPGRPADAPAPEPATGPANPGPNVPPSGPAGEPESSLPRPADPDLVRRLTDAGWELDAAAAVVRHHADWLAELRIHDPGAFERTAVRLAQLPGVADLSEVLADRPELVGLFLLVDDPTGLARVLDGRDGDLLAGLFLAHLARDDARALAAALPGVEDLVADLVFRRGLVGAEALFVFPGDGPGPTAYRDWLAGALREALAGPDDDLAAAVVFLLAEGPEIRARMATDEFRRAFPGKWQTLRRVVGEHRGSVTDLAGLPGVWEFLDRPDAEALLRRRGPLAVDLLSGPGGYGPDVRDRVAELLRTEDLTVARLLLECRGEPAFRPFLERKVPAAVLRGVAADLAHHPGDRVGRLKFLQGKLNDGEDALGRAVGKRPSDGVLEYVPGYSVYSVYRDYDDGREVSGWDVAFAAADVATVALPAGKAGVALVKGGGKAGGKAAATQAGKELVAAEAEAVLKSRLKGEAALAIGTVGATRGGFWMTAKEVYGKGSAVVRSVLLNTPQAVTIPLKSIDITAPVRFVFRHARVGRETFRRLTGLEARLFMRADARVVLRLHYRIEGARIRDWLGRFLLARCGGWAADGDLVPPAVAADTLADPAADWARAAGPLWLAAAVDLLPAADQPD